jgi:putative inorganic carbon (HCO3(-)) transporter
VGQERNRVERILRIVDRLELALLAAMAPFFVFPKTETVWSYLVFPVIWILRWVVEGKGEVEQKGGTIRALRGLTAHRTIIDLAIAVFAIQLFISCLVVADIEASLPKISGILYGILVFYALVRVLKSRRLIRAGIGVFIAGGVTLTVIGMMGMFESREPFADKLLTFLFKKVPHKNWGFQGAELGLNPNAVAGVMTIFIPLSIVIAVWVLTNKRGRESTLSYLQGLAAVVFAVLSCFFCFVLFLTQSVASWLALGISLWLVLPTWKIKAVGLLPALAFVFAVLVFLPGKVNQDTNKEQLLFLKKKVEDRDILWAAGLKAVSEKPITGIGVNQLRMRPGFGYETSHAHNHMLHTAAELGIPGLVAYLAILIGAGWMSWEVWRKATVGWMRVAAQGLAAGQLAHFIFGLGDSIPLGAKPGIFFWVSLALIAAMYHYMRRERRGPATDFRFQKKSEPVFPAIGR